MTTDLELLRCPFCGSAAKWFKTGRDVGIECGDESNCPGNAQTDTYDPENKDIAVRAWNRRAHLAQPQHPDCEHFRKFWEKYALGSKRAPSCLKCGQAKPFVTKHLELPDIGLCAECSAQPQTDAARLECGHHKSLLIKSLESDYQFCELCECRRMKRDAETREQELQAELTALRAAPSPGVQAWAVKMTHEGVYISLHFTKEGAENTLGVMSMPCEITPGMFSEAAQQDCPICKGAGEYPQLVASPEGDPQDTTYETMPCPKCDGTGVAQQDGWRPIETAPKDKSVLLCVNGSYCPIYCGRQRYGVLGEPSQDAFAWRCDSSGRFANPTHWMPLPAPPVLAASQNGRK